MQFANRRLANLGVKPVEGTAIFQHACAESADGAGLQVAGDALDQAGAILGTVFTVLFKLDEVCANEPVAQDEVAVDRARRARLGLLVRVADGGEQGGVVHGITLNVGATWDTGDEPEILSWIGYDFINNGRSRQIRRRWTNAWPAAAIGVRRQRCARKNSFVRPDKFSGFMRGIISRAP